MFELVEPKETTDTCLFDSCDKKVTSRGLCHSHYAVALRIVKKVKGMTWNKLEKNGKCLPARPPFNGANGASTQRDWFLEGFNGKSTKKKQKEVKKLQPKEENELDVVDIKTICDSIHIINVEIQLLKEDIRRLTNVR